jgi:S1-C subfamily serine protease
MSNRAGLRNGDLIIGYNESLITGIDDLHRILTDSQVGTRARITILRGTEKIDLTIIPAESK